MKKKIIYSFGTLAAIAAPVATVVSCGSEKAKNVAVKAKVETNTTTIVQATDFSKVSEADRSVIMAAQGVIAHYSSAQFAASIEYTKIDKSEQGTDVFEYEVKDGVLKIQGSSAIGFSRGFYSWVKANGYGMADYIEHNIVIPSKLTDVEAHREVTPYKHHYILNTATFGYTVAYWGEKEWSEFINWMAVHGYEMPLALKGSNPILARVFKNHGATDADLDKFFSGPAFETWQRQGEDMGWDPNPYRKEFAAKDIKLQHHILKEMKKVGITPIVPCFPGFIPPAVAEREGIEVVNEKWGAFPDNGSKLINVNSADGKGEIEMKAFANEYVKEYEKEYGAQDFYLADTFEEMDIPGNEDGKVEFIHKTARGIYEGIQTATRENGHESIFVVQGWDFGYQPRVWNQRRFDAYAMVSDETNEEGSIYESEYLKNHQLFIDLAEDYSHNKWHKTSPYIAFDGFRGRQWIYSTTSNMGGKVQRNGNFRWYSQAGPEALADTEHRRNLVGYGVAAEGIENNQMMFELLSDMGWRDTAMTEEEFKAWVDNYTLNRYKVDPSIFRHYWMTMCKPGNPYGTHIAHPWSGFQQFIQWHDPNKNSWDIQNEETINAYKEFVTICKQFMNTPNRSKLLEKDLYENETFILTHKIDAGIKFVSQNAATLRRTDPAKLKEISDQILGYFDLADEILANYPLWSLKRYLEQARAFGDTEEQKNYYEQDAKRIITTWGIERSIHEYAGKVWSGTMKLWYKPQVKDWLDHMQDPVAHPQWKWGYVYDSVTEANRYRGDLKDDKYQPVLRNENEWMNTPIREEEYSQARDDAFEWSIEQMEPIMNEFDLTTVDHYIDRKGSELIKVDGTEHDYKAVGITINQEAIDNMKDKLLTFNIPADLGGHVRIKEVILTNGEERAEGTVHIPVNKEFKNGLEVDLNHVPDTFTYNNGASMEIIFEVDANFDASTMNFRADFTKTNTEHPMWVGSVNIAGQYISLLTKAGVTEVTDEDILAVLNGFVIKDQDLKGGTDPHWIIDPKYPMGYQAGKPQYGIARLIVTKDGEDVRVAGVNLEIKHVA